MNGIHSADWVDYEAWQMNLQIGSLKDLNGILEAIFYRLNGPLYGEGRME